MLRILTLCCLVIGSYSYSASAPLIPPCKPGDSTCLTSSTKAAIAMFARGVPELGIEPVDPMKVPLVESDHAGLKLTFKDSVLTGIKDCELQSVKHDPIKMKQSATLKCSVVLKGQYKLDGRLIIMPVRGQGPFSITVDDLVIKVSFDLATVTGSDGQPHWHIVKRRHSFKVLTRAVFDFENLFDGNKALGQPVLDFANSQWKEVMAEVAPPVVDTMVDQMINRVGKLYKEVPASALTQ
ncbi:protein takeout-like [Bicyclus anynana]|uniref:Protein takeout-like n=1 Tax=Bicyclus anynana TaxID=110368 RepID=A0ABM3LPA3_BICAN|nr:protein takeout-like [Bicyclus anynana]